MQKADALDYLQQHGVTGYDLLRVPNAWHVVNSFGIVVGEGSTVREAMAAAGYALPKAGVFASRGNAVYDQDGVATVATTKSNTMAQRIANALNSYKPGRKGF
jgi:hypothetical protein